MVHSNISLRHVPTCLHFPLLHTNHWHETGFLDGSFRLDGKHVVFGSVSEGMDVVRAIEGVGSGSGATRAKVVIEDCGQL